MKYCGLCGTPLEDAWALCPQCGTPSEVPETVLPEKPKRRVWLIVLAIVLSVALVFGAIVPLSVWWIARQNAESAQDHTTAPTQQALLTAVDNEKQEETPQDSEESPPEEHAIAYTEGVVIDGVYRNEWLGLTFDLSRTFPQYDENDQLKYESAYNDCGYASIGPGGEHQLVLLFEDMTRTTSVYTDAASCAQETYESATEAYGKAAVTKPTTRRIAGRAYRVLRMEIDDMVQYVALADADDMLVMLIVFSSDEDRILKAFDAMTALP